MEGTVYLITNSVNGKKYVGSTNKTIEERMRNHRGAIARQQHKPLYKDMNIFGFSKFDIEPLLTMKCFDVKELLIVEDAYIAIYDTINNGYNMKYNTFQREYDLEVRRVHRATKIACKYCQKVVSRSNMFEHIKRVHKVN